jgi:signal transduction histidine kinase
VANLVGNAIKYSPPASRIEVALGPGEGKVAWLEVRDQGIGMTPEELERVFERFTRADRARERGTPGLGLGLYACRGIVTAHGGTIRMESEGPDRGTTVIVTLPTIDEDAADRE